MFIDRILSPIEALGPGNRLVIWTKGCSKHCKGCANPELWSISAARNYSVEDIYVMIRNIYNDQPFDGITISGGDPLEQKEALLIILPKLREIVGDILVYTGYELKEVEACWDIEELDILKTNVSVLIDGPYIEELNDDHTALIGSTNQHIYYFDEKIKEKYEKYICAGRKIQNVYMGRKLVSVGIHNKN